jgi:hypothetical protein
MESVLFGRATRLVGVLLAVLVVTSGAAVAQSDSASDQPEWAAAAFAEYEGMVAVYNESISSVDLGVAGDQLSNERVNLVVTDADGATATISFRMDSQLRMTELQLGERPDATLRMSTDRGTFDGILAADNPAVDFRNAVTSGDVTFDGLGTTNAVKWVVINTAANLARSLGLF